MRSARARVQGGEVCNNQHSFFPLERGVVTDVRPVAIKGLHGGHDSRQHQAAGSLDALLSLEFVAV